MNIGISEIKLGRTLLREHRYQEAEPHLLAGYQIANHQSSPSVTWVNAARKDLVMLYDESGQPEKAGPYRASR